MCAIIGVSIQGDESEEKKNERKKKETSQQTVRQVEIVYYNRTEMKTIFPQRFELAESRLLI